jgi:hypothetical protein
MSTRRAIGALFVTAALVFAAGAAAKEFGPGDLRVCGTKTCLPIGNQRVLTQLSRFYYSARSPARMLPPSRGAPFFELKFSNEYVTGIVASGRLDRFLSYGVHLGHFKRGTWYRVPARAALELRRLTAGLAPFHLSAAAVAESR